jgi:23S rRNA (uracil1939-C5)-methyltransferase
MLASIFVASASSTLGFDSLFNEWKKRIPALVGAELVEEGGMGNAPRVLARSGESSLTYRACGFDFRADHGAFFQVNRWLIDDLCKWVVADRRGRLAWDLFAGVGLFANSLAKNFERVVAVESAPMASAALKHNLKNTSGEGVLAETATFLRNPGETPRPDLIVVDPPRAGLGTETTSLLAEAAAPEIVYVSCDPATLSRDLRVLLSSGYELHSVMLADLFPQTFHLESVVELRRS